MVIPGACQDPAPCGFSITISFYSKSDLIRFRTIAFLNPLPRESGPGISTPGCSTPLVFLSVALSDSPFSPTRYRKASPVGRSIVLAPNTLETNRKTAHDDSFEKQNDSRNVAYLPLSDAGCHWHTGSGVKGLDVSRSIPSVPSVIFVVILLAPEVVDAQNVQSRSESQTIA